MLSAVHLLTSRSKIDMIELLARTMSPEDMAGELHMTRQAVDRHLKDFMRYGLVEKMWVTGGRRPRVEFRLSRLGRDFHDGLQEFVSGFRKSGREDIDRRLKELDLKLIRGEANQRSYLEMRKDLEEGMNWFTTDEKDERPAGRQ